MLDWDTTKIVFSKRTLLEFLKYTGCTVDTNCTLVPCNLVYPIAHLEA